MQRQEIDELLDELLRHEMPANVEMHPAPHEARRILDEKRRNCPRDAGHRRFAENLDGKDLPERLHTIEEAGRLHRADRYNAGSDIERVAFVAESGESGVEPEDYAVAGGSSGCADRHVEASRRPEISC